MKGTFKLVGVCFFTLCCCPDLLPQEGPQYNRKMFDTRVILKSEPARVRGVFYEARDSSILLSNSRIRNDYLSGNFSITEISYLDINRLQLRRKNAAVTGALIGGGISGLLAVQFIREMFGGSGASGKDMAGLFLLIGAPITMIGVGAGVLIGSIPVTIPINGRFDQFDSQRRRLIDKALLVYDLDDIQRRASGMMEHGSYAGWLIGPSFPVGAFAGASDSGNDRIPKTGYSSEINLRFTFRQGFSVSLSAFFNAYNLTDEHPDVLWDVSGFTIGPLFGFSLTEKSWLDLLPGIGIMNALLGTEEIPEKSVNGIAINPRIAFRYNIATRWALLSRAEYMYAIPGKGDTDASLLGLTNLQIVNVGFGVGYKFR
jgi:hypothetical protein